MAEIHTDSDGYKSTTAEIPGLGTAQVYAGVDFYRVEWSREEPLVVNNVAYRGEVTVPLDDEPLKFYLKRAGTIIAAGSEATPAATKKIREAIAAWLPTFRDTDEAREILAATATKHNGFGRDHLTKEIARTEQHLAELRALLARLDAAGPTEYVSTYGTTYELRERNR